MTENTWLWIGSVALTDALLIVSQAPSTLGHAALGVLSKVGYGFMRTVEIDLDFRRGVPDTCALPQA